jgi:NADH-quinone oxidoreductase subunit N
MDELQRSLPRFGPELITTAALLLVILVDATGMALRNGFNRLITALGLAAALVACAPLARPEAAGSLFSGMLHVDPMGVFFKVLLLGASLLLLLSFTFKNSRELFGLGQGEFYALLLALTLSNLLLAAANDTVMLYLALEMVSITSYVMVAYMKGDRMSNEASLKYVLFGAVSTGAMLYGLSLLFGLTGATEFGKIQEALLAGLTDQNRRSAYAILLLIFSGFAFKTAVAPFHFWCPDVYEGAPTPVTALLSVAPKAAGFAVMLRFFSSSVSSPLGGPLELVGTVDWPALLTVVSILTMTVGNVAALTQTNMKRLLAYSSIAHAGFILMGVVALSETGARGLMVYLLAYLFMNLGAFLVVTLVHRQDGTFDLRDYAGLVTRSPFLTFAMAVFVLSLVGIPPLVGYLGKLYVFAAAIQGGLYTLALAGALNAALGAYYYFRILKTMIVETADATKPAFDLPLVDKAWLVVFMAANIAPILFWSVIEGWTRSSLPLLATR